MRLLTLLVSTAILAVVSTPDASAQTTTRRSRLWDDPPLVERPKVKAPAAGVAAGAKKGSRLARTPAPAVPVRPSRRAARSIGTSILGVDETGRKDKSGHSVAFYPTARGRVPTGMIPSAAPIAPTAAPRTNPSGKPGQ